MIVTYRKGFTVVELLVVMSIIAVLLGLLLPAIQKARESASRAECANNLKQLGIAIHGYHHVAGLLPCESRGPSVFTSILPFIEQDWQSANVTIKADPHGTAVQWDKARPVKQFLCPSRRPPDTNPS